jgi:hypothetical protein
MPEEDPEISAIALIASALESLDEDARRRVLEWAARRFDIGLSSGAGAGLGKLGSHRERAVPTGDQGLENGEFQDFVDLFDAAGPSTEAERALVGGYWFQAVSGNSDFQAQQVNTALKDVGQGVGNITEAFSTLQGRRPALVRQVAKSGRSRQARKKYKLTTAGTSAVRQMLARADTGEEEL